MISDAEIEELQKYLDSIDGLGITRVARSAVQAVVQRLRAAEKERDQLREWQAYMRSPHSPIRNDTIDQCAKVCRETRGTKTFFGFYDTGERERGCEQCEEAILALKDTP